MLRAMARKCVWLPVSLMAIAGCGSSAPSAKSAATDSASGLVAGVRIGEAAVSQGGLATLGGDRATPAPPALRAQPLASPLKLDGLTREWPPLTPARTIVAGTASDRTMLSAGVQYDEANLYVAADVGDERLVRTARFTDQEDHASLLLAFPSPSGAWVTYEVGLFAGRAGESVGAVRMLAGPRKGQRIAGARIVEAPTTGGYSLEAAIPWTAFPEARSVRVGLRGAVRYYDADTDGQVARILATGPGDAAMPSALPWLPVGAEQALLDELLAPNGLDRVPPLFDLVADLGGDTRKERVAVFGHFLIICGPGYRDGQQYFYRELSGELVRIEACELTARGKDDLVLRRRQREGTLVREVLEVWSLLGGDEPLTTFSHEIAVFSGNRRATNSVRLSPREIELSVEPPAGWDAASYTARETSDAAPLLVPWGPVRSEVFRFEGARFERTSQLTQRPAAATSETPARVALVTPPEPPAPAVTKGGDDSQRLFDQFRRDVHASPGVVPHFDLQVHVAEDARPERVVLLGRNLAVFGPGFQRGQRYSYTSLQQFAGEDDIRDLVARDLTGDGAADLIVRGVRRVAAADGQGPVNLDVLFVYTVRDGALARVFAIETGREQAGRRVQGLMQFVSAAKGKGFVIEVRPGQATGWTEKTYPWPQAQPGTEPLEPLLLPWGKIASLRYEWNGTRFAR